MRLGFCAYIFGVVVCTCSALGQTWLEMGPAISRNGQVEGMSGQSNPVYGAVNVLAVHPTDPNILLLGGVNGGVWRTTNATSANPTWTPTSDFISSLSIGALAFDRGNSNTVYAGIGRFSSLSGTGGGRDGLYVSTNAGLSFAPVAGNAAFTGPGSNIASVAANGQTIIVAVNTSTANSITDQGVWRSINGGLSFSHTSGAAVGLPNVTASAVVADPTNANRYYVAAPFSFVAGARGVYRSDDKGVSWTRISDPGLDAILDSTTNLIDLSVSTTGTLFAGVVDSGRLAGVFRTTDQGGSWTSFGVPTTSEGPGPMVIGIHAGGQGATHFSIAAHPTDANVVYLGGDRQPLGIDYGGSNPNSLGANNFTGRLFRSTAANSWTSLTHNGTASNSAPHADSRAMAVDANGNIVEVDDGGVYRRTSPTTTTGNWTSMGDSSLRVTEFHSVAFDNHGSIIIGGTQDTGTVQQSASGSMTWDTVNQGDGGVVAVFDRAGAGDSFRYSSAQFLGGFQRREFNLAGTQIGASTFPARDIAGSGGKRLNNTPNQQFDSNIQFYTKYMVNKVDAGRLVFGTRSLYETSDHASNLTVLGGLLTATADGLDNDGDGMTDEADERKPSMVFNSAVGGLAYGGFKGVTGFSDVLYSGAGSELRIRAAGGGFNNLPGVNAAYNTAAGSSQTIKDIVLDSTDWDIAFVADSLERVFMTPNGGGSWSQIPGLAAVIGDELEAIEFVESGTLRAIFAGGRNGVFISRDLGSGFGGWLELGGATLPNAKVRDLDYDSSADTLLVGLQGRGAWVMRDVSLLLVPEPGVLLLGVMGVMVGMRRRR
ncbi:MAG TPA: hypothetical protein VGQ99_07650 [Tepidisphaeraceae bacterium]|nr:hypothetical protein [Tepidisphaeraceae bacterium]